jgi:ribulose-5-phosphate 4-epimerase/fuculose-1-phosphate aldolase
MELEQKKREELSIDCREVYQREMVSSSGGNISLKIDHGLLITPTGVSLGRITPECLVKVGLDGIVQGPGRPSKELVFHLQAYMTRPDIGAVVHVHSSYAVTLTCMLAKNPFPIPAMTPGYAVRVGNLPMIPMMIPGTPELAEAVKNVIAARDSVLLGKHGVVVVGRDLQSALNMAEEIEENAKIIVLGGSRAVGLTEEEVAAVRKLYVKSAKGA